MKKLGPNHTCGCGSEKKHKKCCFSTAPWYVDNQGRIMDGPLASIPEFERKPLMAAYRQSFGFEARRQAEIHKFLAEADSAQIVPALLSAGDHPARIYAIEKTGRYLPAGWAKWAGSTYSIMQFRDGRFPQYYDGMMAVIEYLQIADPSIEAVVLSAEDIARRVIGEATYLAGHEKTCMCVGCRILDAFSGRVLISLLSDDQGFKPDPSGILFIQEIVDSLINYQDEGHLDASAVRALGAKLAKVTQEYLP